jgi:pyruvate,water dikinase
VSSLCQKGLEDPDIIAFTRGYEGNVTTEMDLHVADLADIARRFPAVVEKIQKEPRASVLSSLKNAEGGEIFLDKLHVFLETYGMRGASEIDITRTRWAEDPTPLLQTIAGNLKSETNQQHRQRHQHLLEEAEEAGKRLVTHARQMPGGWWRGPLVKRLVRVHRDLMGIREHPKFGLIRLMGLLRDLLSKEAHSLQQKGWIDESKDIDFFSLEEIQEIIQQSSQEKASKTPNQKTSKEGWKDTLQQRKADHERFAKMSPPRVLTQHGENVIAELRRENLPAGALVGSRASAGIVEGIARVILDPSDASLHHGEILVAPFTDPGWTPLFIHAAGLVMEVGGLMTHGSVVAREYGIPAVVSVSNATKLIQTGQRVRINGDLGYVEILKETEA